MKRLITFAASACLSICAGTVHGQVTIFGVMDLSLRSVHNQGVASIQGMASGGNATSRLGVLAVETSR